MTPELIKKIRKDYEAEPNKENLCYASYIAGYLQSMKRFAERPNRREVRSKLSYSRIGLNNV